MSFRRYPDYKDSSISWIGSIPSEWQVRKISHSFGSVGSGTTPSTSDEKWFSQGEIPWVTTGELRENTIDRTKKYLIPEALEAFSALQIHPKGALVIAMYGATIGRLGVLGIPATTNQACCALSQPKSLDVRFTFYWLLVHREPIVSLFSSGGGQPNINRETVTNLRVPAPKLSEQAQIARFLDHETAKIDTLIHEQKRLIELLKKKRQAVISHTVTKGLDPDVPMKDSRVEWLGDVPAHWTVTRLKRCSTRIVVGIAEAATHAYVDDGGIPILRATNVREGRIIGELLYLSKEYADARDSKRMQANDLVTVRTGNAGVTALVPQELDGCQCFTMLITTLDRECEPKFFEYFMGSPYCQSYFKLEGWGTAQVNISVPILEGLPILKPPCNEQLEIAEALVEITSEIDKLIEQSNHGTSLLKERRSALISAAVTGKIDVRNWQPPADESALDEVAHGRQKAEV